MSCVKEIDPHSDRLLLGLMMPLNIALNCPSLVQSTWCIFQHPNIILTVELLLVKNGLWQFISEYEPLLRH